MGIKKAQIPVSLGNTQAPIDLNEQAAPGATANKNRLYAKDVSGTAELFAQDDQGNEVQITSNGVVNSGGAGGWPLALSSSIYNTSFAAVANEIARVDPATTITATLPASPPDNTVCAFVPSVGVGTTGELTVSGNGNTILSAGLASVNYPLKPLSFIALQFHAGSGKWFQIYGSGYQLGSFAGTTTYAQPVTTAGSPTSVVVGPNSVVARVGSNWVCQAINANEVLGRLGGDITTIPISSIGGGGGFPPIAFNGDMNSSPQVAIAGCSYIQCQVPVCTNCGTLTLPASPADGAEVGMLRTCGSASLSVNGNGKQIFHSTCGGGTSILSLFSLQPVVLRFSNSRNRWELAMGST